jgi:alpha-L-fucosidase 2
MSLNALLPCLLSTIGASPTFPAEHVDVWRGYRRHVMTVDGCQAWAVEPKQPAAGNPWAWCLEFPDAFIERTGALRLLDAGYWYLHIVVGNTFGCPAALKHFDAFYQVFAAAGLAPKGTLIGVSRGGLYAYRWAAHNTDKVACVYGDAPVCDFKSWPGGKGSGPGSRGDWQALIKDYGFKDEAEALAYQENPVDLLAPLAAANIPLVHVVGDADEVVPFGENTAVMAKRYADLGGRMTVHHKPGGQHHPHGLTDPAPVVDFIERATAHALDPYLPGPQSDLALGAPIATWDEALPLGNGLLGGLLWGGDHTLRLSLDRGDLWDERPATNFPADRFNYATMVKLARAGQINDLNAIFDQPYNDRHPTKIPAGRLEIDLGEQAHLTGFELRLATAEGRAELADGSAAEAFFSAEQPLALLRLPLAPAAVKLLAPASLKQLGYADPETGADGGQQWFLQTCADGLRYCVLLARQDRLLALTVTSTADGPDPLALAKQQVEAALAAGYDGLRAGHRRWWSEFWHASRVDLPEPDLDRHYHLVQYLGGAASRLGAPPMPLQGVWTQDAGGLPPWKGDYHNDLNTQMTYMAYQAAGHFDEGRSFLEFNWRLLPRYRLFAHQFYGVDGAAVPGVMSLAGQPLGGWGQYSLSPTMGAWIGHLFYLHWRYSGDEAFLKERALPWCREVGTALRALMAPDAEGRLCLPLSSSPEIHDNTLAAFLKPMSNFDIACSRMLFLALAEMAQAAGETIESAAWRAAADQLGPLHTRADGVLKLNGVEDLTTSHRHLSNLMGIYPFNLLTIDGGAEQRRIIEASVADWDRLGTSAWCGYSFTWMSALRARAGQPEAALRLLDVYTHAFTLRNGFHANGDQTGSGYSGFTYRPFTLEGNFLAAAATHEMLLQSWSAEPGTGAGGVIRVFPAMPWRWHAAEFADLRAEGGHRVAARRANNATVWLKVTAGADGEVRIRDNFGGRVPAWSRPDVSRDGADWRVTLKRGESLEATLPTPEALPAPPADLAQPVPRRAR